MTEKELKAQFVAKARKRFRGAVVLRHEDLFTAGIPDISITYHGITMWLEVKYKRFNKQMKMRLVQKLTCQNLADNGFCLILIYEDTYEGPVTHLVEPKNVETWQTKKNHFHVTGYNHDQILDELDRNYFGPNLTE